MAALSSCGQKVRREGGVDHGWRRWDWQVHGETRSSPSTELIKLVIADVQDDDLGLSLCKDLSDSSLSSSSCVHCDVTKQKDVKNAVNTAVSKYGKLDIMFNNAGIFEGMESSIADSEKSTFEQVIGVNLVVSFLGTKYAASDDPQREGLHNFDGEPERNHGGVGTYAYICSKHGVVGLMRNGAADLGRCGIRVNCASSYSVPTPMRRTYLKVDDEGIAGLYSNLKGTAIGPQDTAEAVIYLASEESKYVSGHNLVVDGGYSVVNAGLCYY